MTELRAEMKRWLLQYESLEEELDQLIKEYDNQVDINHQLEKGKRCNLPEARMGGHGYSSPLVCLLPEAVPQPAGIVCLFVIISEPAYLEHCVTAWIAFTQQVISFKASLSNKSALQCSSLFVTHESTHLDSIALRLEHG